MYRPYSSQLRFRLVDFDKIPENACGIYGLWFGRRCIYIGKAKSQPIKARLRQHWTEARNQGLADWISAKGPELIVAYEVIDEPDEIDSREKQYIQRYQPLTNIIRYDD